jgi:leucyl/phenylalanyl-tRNA--protein transferase
MSDEIDLTAELLLRAYSIGIFPMAESAEGDRLAWFDPDPRGIIPLDNFHVPRRLARTVRPKTWINARIRTLCLELHGAGYAHSIEVWRAEKLVGGLYGVVLGGAFFGESMFSRARDASKVALVHLVARLVRCGFSLLDSQFATGHLAQFGVTEIPRAEYRRRLARALTIRTDFHGFGAEDAASSPLPQATTEIS